jgi:protein-disulfide isomerase
VSKRVSQKQAARFMREQAARERARRRRIVVSIAAAAVLLVAGLIGWGVYANQHHTSYTAPKTASSQADGLVLGSGPVTVDIYLDFMCPVCKQYEDATGQTLTQYVTDNKIRLVYHPIAILDDRSSTQYSTRSSASSACAADAGKLAPYVSALYSHQPEEGSAGLSNDELISIAKGAGITDSSFASCVNSGKYVSWSTHVTDAATARGVNATPTVFVAGKQVTNTLPALQAAVSAAAPKS